MGRWFVVAGIPTMFEKGMINAIEDYRFNAKKQRIDVSFYMQSKPSAKPTTVLQRAKITNTETNTRWSLNPKVGFAYLPLRLSYLVIDCADDYSTCIIGVPDRAYLWIMARKHDIEESVLETLISRCQYFGYDITKIVGVNHDYSSVSVPPFAYEEQAADGGSK